VGRQHLGYSGDMPTHILAVFAVLHALATVFRTELAWTLVDPVSPAETAATYLTYAAAVLVLLRPSNLRVFLGFATCQVVCVAIEMPVVPNHWLLSSLANIGILLAALERTRTLGRLPSHEELWRVLVTPMRFGVAGFYLFTGFWKLNDQFADPDSSCATEAVGRLSDHLPFLPTDGLALELAIAGTYALELVGPVLLLLPTTRRAALLGFVAFHGLLAIDLVQFFLNFSGVMFALLLFFAEERAVDEDLAFLDPSRLHRAWAVIAVCAVGTVYVLSLALPAAELTEVYDRLRWLVFLLAYLPFVVALYAGLVRQAPLPPPRSRGSLAWTFLALVIVNGVSPIVGLKDRNSWQMYSNLRLEPAYSNHWVIGRSLDLLGHQSESVIVHRVSDSRLASDWIGPGRRVALYMVRWHAWENPSLTVTFTYDGKVHDARPAGEDPLLIAPSWPMRKVSWHRVLGEPVAYRCQW
jgi:hypothetical protein